VSVLERETWPRSSYLVSYNVKENNKYHDLLLVCSMLLPVASLKLDAEKCPAL
jgi:hypothetical protein